MPAHLVRPDAAKGPGMEEHRWDRPTRGPRLLRLAIGVLLLAVVAGVAALVRVGGEPATELEVAAEEASDDGTDDAPDDGTDDASDDRADEGPDDGDATTREPHGEGHEASGDADNRPDDDDAALPEAAGDWRAIPDPPVRRRVSEPVWTGEELAVWGGARAPEQSRAQEARRDETRGEFLADGAAYDPNADRWRALPRAPLEARAGHVSVWTGEELVVWGGGKGTALLADGAAYDPGTDEWRRISDGPLSPRWGAIGVWTGSEVLVVGGHDYAGELRDGAAYDPTADRWRSLAPAPQGVGGVRAPLGMRGELPRMVAQTRDAGTWTGDRLAVLGAPHGPGEEPVVLGYDPETDRWSRLAELPETRHGSSPRLVSAGDRLAMVSHAPTGRPRIHLRDASAEEWRTVKLPDDASWAPDSGASNDWVSVWADGTMYLAYPDLEDRGFVVDLDAQEWRKLPPSDRSSGSMGDTASVEGFWTGDALLIWGGPLPGPPGSAPGETPSLRWSPASPASAS